MAFSKTTSTIAASVVALAAMVGSASAATWTLEEGDDILTADDFVLINTTLTPADTSATITFTAAESIRLSQFAVTGNGFSGGADLLNVTFGYTSAGASESKNFDIDEILPGPRGVSDELPGLTLFSGDTLDVFANYGGGDRNVDVDIAFETALVPIPAAGGLLLGALGLGGLVARRKKKAS